MKSTVQVIGWYNKRNTGDEAYKLAFPAIFNHDFIFSDIPKPDHASYILGGGDILSSSFLNSISKVHGKKTIASTAFPENIDKTLLSQFETVIVRDEQSLINAQKIGVNAILAPDFAFALQGDPFSGRRLIKDIFKEASSDLYEKTVGVVVNAHLLPTHGGQSSDSARFDNFCYDMASALDQTNASIIFLPFGKSMPWDDRVSNSIIASRTKYHKKNVCVYKDLSVQENLDIISAVDCLISTRLHSTIFAISNSVPFVDITHNHKNSNLLRTLNLEDYSLSYRKSNTEDIKECIYNRLISQKEIRQKLLIVSEQQRDALKGIVTNVCLV